MKQLFSKRDIKYCVLHCTAGNQNNSAEQVKSFLWQRFNHSGYHVVIEKQQRNQKLNSGVIRLESDDNIGYGVKEYRDKNGVLINNSNSIHICWIGGLLSDKYGNVLRDNNKKASNGWLGDFIATDNRTDYQKQMLKSVVKYYRDNTDVIFLGHNQISPDIKSCPNFDVRVFAKECGVLENRIYMPDNFGVVEKLPLILKSLKN